MTTLNIARSILNNNNTKSLENAILDYSDRDSQFFGHDVTAIFSDSCVTLYFSDDSILDNSSTFWRAL